MGTITAPRRVATGSAARFAERARQARRRRNRQIAIALTVVVSVAALTWFCYSGPLLAVRQVEVVGVTGSLAAAIDAQAQSQLDIPLPQLDVEKLQAELAAPLAIRSVTVTKSWPSTLRIAVVARTPIAAVPSGRSYRLVDNTGTAYSTVTVVPPGVPLMRVPLDRPSLSLLQAALVVLRAMPGQLRRQVGQVSVGSVDDVRMIMGSRTIVWGNAQQVTLKVEVLVALLRQPARIYDVSSPRTPVLR